METALNIRLNNHHSNCRVENELLNIKHEKYILRAINTNRKLWVKKLKTLVSLGLAKELSDWRPLHCFFMFNFTKVTAILSPDNTNGIKKP